MSNRKTSATNESNINQVDIRRVLKNWHDSNKLGQDALATLGIVKQQRLKEGYGDTHEGHAQALRSILQNVIGEIKTIARDEDLHDDQWIYFVILTEQFINRRKSDAVYDELAISKRAYFNKQKDALSAVAAKVEELEAQNRTTQTAQTITAPPEPVSPPDVKNFIGRTKELAYFQEKLEQLNYAVIVGFPGTGKTLLAAKLIRETSDSSHLFWYKCRSGDTVDSLLWALAGFLVSCGQDKLWRNLHAAREQARQDVIPANMRINYAKDLLSQQPYAICFDDFQLIADTPDVFSFVKQLHELTQTSQLRLLITSHGMPSFVRQRFEPLIGLTIEDTKLLVATRNISLEQTQIAALHKLTEGQPVFLNLALDILAETGDTERLLQHLPQEENIEQYLLQSVDQQLTHDERVLMSGIAVLGDQTSGRDIIETVVDGGRISRPLRNLSMRNLLAVSIGPHGREYTQHSIVRAFYYDELGIRERHAMHQRAGEYYADEERDYFHAALHYSYAGNQDDAARLAVQDVWNAINRGYARMLLDLLDGFEIESLKEDEQAQVLAAQGQIHAILGNYDGAIEAFDAALEHLSCRPVSTENHLAQARIHHAKGALIQYDDTNMALETLQAGIDLLQLEQNDNGEVVEMLAALYIKLSSAQLAAGNLDEAEKSIGDGVDLLDDDETPLYVDALINRAYAEYDRGNISKCIEYAEEALITSEALGEADEYRKANIFSNLGSFKFINDQWIDAIENMKSGLAIADRIGSALIITRSHVNLGTAYVRTGNLELAGEHLATGEKMARKHQLTEQLVLALGTMAELYIKQNEPDDALAPLDEAEEMHTERSAAQDELIEVLRLRAEAKLQKGLVGEALADANRSVEIAAGLNMALEHGMSLRVLGMVLYAAQKLPDGDIAFQKSIDLLNDTSNYEMARTQMTWGQLLNQNEPTCKNKKLLTQAKDVFEKLGAKHELGILKHNL